MFTGIVESLGEISKMEHSGTNISFTIKSGLASECKVDQSISHNGVCLTVEEVDGNVYKVTAIAETIAKTNLGTLQIGSLVNLERCMQLNGRLDGHIVQGHVDTTAQCLEITEKGGSWEYVFEIKNEYASLIIEKGSITLNGISLTIFELTKTTFKVAVIPYTYQHTNIKGLKAGDLVNIEFDMIGKYVNRIIQLKD